MMFHLFSDEVEDSGTGIHNNNKVGVSDLT